MSSICLCVTVQALFNPLAHSASEGVKWGLSKEGGRRDVLLRMLEFLSFLNNLGIQINQAQTYRLKGQPQDLS
jgi:hypothetical protein